MSELGQCLGIIRHFKRRQYRLPFAQAQQRDPRAGAALAKRHSVIANRRRHSQAQRQFAEERGGARVRGESVFAVPKSGQPLSGIAAVAANEPTPQHLAEVSENCRLLLGKLPDDTLRTIALKKLNGDTNAAIAAEMGIVERSVERKLQIIRKGR